MDEKIELGGNIELCGFKDSKGGEMIVIKKIIGNHVKRITELSSKFEKIKITLKTVHETEKNRKFEIHVLLSADKQYNVEITERNLFYGIDLALKKVINSIA